jgi:hypothetical protein
LKSGVVRDFLSTGWPVPIHLEATLSGNTIISPGLHRGGPASDAALYPNGPRTVRTILLRTSLGILLASGVPACDSSARFGGDPRGQSVRAGVAPQPFAPAPTAPVTATSLPPPVSQQGAPAPSTDVPRGNSSAGSPMLGQGVPTQSSPSQGLPPPGASVPIDPDLERRAPEPPRSAPPVAPPPAPRVAARTPEPPASSGQPTRTGVIGNWSAREASGNSCRVTLSSTPTLDLYRASSSGCQSREMQRVSAWELRGDEIYLYEPGGGVAARLRQSGRNFEGTAARTGASISLSK